MCAGSAGGGQSYTSSSLMGPVLCLSHPEKLWKLKPGKKEAAERKKKTKTKNKKKNTLFYLSLLSPHPQTTKHPITTQQLGWNESQRCD